MVFTGLSKQAETRLASMSTRIGHALSGEKPSRESIPKCGEEMTSCEMFKHFLFRFSGRFRLFFNGRRFNKSNSLTVANWTPPQTPTR